MMPAVAPASADMEVRQYSKMAEFWRTDSSLYATASAMRQNNNKKSNDYNLNDWTGHKTKRA